MNNITIMFQKIKINKGCSAGGKNTNFNGLSYENITNITIKLESKEIKKFGKNINDIYHMYEINNNIIYRLIKNGLKNFLINEYNSKCEKNLEPDECFVNVKNKKIYILEKKFQQVSGSVDEKIQTAQFKFEYYKELYPTFTIKYAYVLSDWFKADKYKPEMRYLEKYNFAVFWGSDENYIKNLIKWIN